MCCFQVSCSSLNRLEVNSGHYRPNGDPSLHYIWNKYHKMYMVVKDEVIIGETDHKCVDICYIQNGNKVYE